ncbi:MAG: biotin--[acetyl-CoA-carboxylase] ligase [Bacteroidia bacterium]
MSKFKFTLKELRSVDSTNNYLRNLDFTKLPNGYCVLANQQLSGKGQRGKVWKTNAGENLTFSFFLKNADIPPSDQFKLLQLISLSVLNTVQKLTGAVAKIKWPNDIMVGNQKIAGILIENFIQSGTLNSVIGIGLNVNQKQFENYSPQATSLSSLSGYDFNLKMVLSFFEHEFLKLFDKLTPAFGQLDYQYRNQLYALGEMHAFETSKGKYMVSEVIGIDRFGRLIINVDGIPTAFLNGQLRWVF